MDPREETHGDAFGVGGFVKRRLAIALVVAMLVTAGVCAMLSEPVVLE